VQFLPSLVIRGEAIEMHNPPKIAARTALRIVGKASAKIRRMMASCKPREEVRACKIITYLFPSRLYRIV
jgi:hypothetical protein